MAIHHQEDKPIFLMFCCAFVNNNLKFGSTDYASYIQKAVDSKMV